MTSTQLKEEFRRIAEAARQDIDNSSFPRTARKRLKQTIDLEEKSFHQLADRNPKKAEVQLAKARTSMERTRQNWL